MSEIEDLGISSNHLKKGKRYRFFTYKNLNNEDTNPNKPHYYEGTYNGRKGTRGPDKSIWVFKNFTDITTNEKKPIKEIKFFGALSPTVGLLHLFTFQTPIIYKSIFINNYL